jgi:hypothetical protein
VWLVIEILRLESRRGTWQISSTLSDDAAYRQCLAEVNFNPLIYQTLQNE